MHHALPLLLLCAACAAPAPPRAGDPTPLDRESLALARALHAGDRAPLGPTARRAAPRPGPAAPPLTEDMFGALGATLTGGRLDPSLGAALLDELEAWPSDEVAEYGAGVFTLTELYGPQLDGVGGLCEDPHALFTFTEDGTEWEVDLRLFAFLQLTGPVQTLFMTLSAPCAEGVAALGGDVDAALDEGVCTESELLGFFPEGGDCRACVADAESVAACEEQGRCPVEVPLLDKQGARWFEWAEAEGLACAPDVPVRVWLGAKDLADDGTVPESWDHTSWSKLCFLLRDEDSGEVLRECAVEADGTDELGDGVGDGVISRITFLREAGGDALTHAERVGYNRALAFADGTVTEQFLLSFGGIGQISTPAIQTDMNGDGTIDDDDWGGAYGGWGFNPRMLRPDGTDPTDLDHTYARDWLGSVAVKMSTTRDGVPINVMNHSRCLEWVGPHEDGTFTCVLNGGPALGWFEDNHVFPGNSAFTRIYPEPLMTVGSTGLPDPLVPGGFAPLMAGTPALGRPTWDDCTWAHTFLPDHIRTEDNWLDWGGTASLDAHTYRFGKDPDLDLRVVLATSQARGFCTEWQ